MVVSGSSLAQGNCEVLTTMLRASHSNRLSCDPCPIMFKNFAYYGLLVLMSSNNYLFLFSLTNTNFRSRRTRYSACMNLFRKPLWAYSQGRSPKWCPALLLLRPGFVIPRARKPMNSALRSEKLFGQAPSTPRAMACAIRFASTEASHLRLSICQAIYIGVGLRLRS